MAKKEHAVDLDFVGNALLNKGEESISPAVIITPTTFAANQDNYNPTSLQVAGVLKLSCTGNRDITGIVEPTDTTKWKLLILINVGSSTITLKNNSANSSANNRFLIGKTFNMNTDQACVIFYDQTSKRWRILNDSL